MYYDLVKISMYVSREKKKNILVMFLYISMYDNRNNEHISCFINRAREKRITKKILSIDRNTFFELYQEVMCLKNKLYTTSLFESVFLKKVIFESFVDLMLMVILNQANMYFVLILVHLH